MRRTGTRRGRLDLLEVTLIAALVGAAVWVLKPLPPLPAHLERSLPLYEEFVALQKAYGPDKNSSGPEEWIIRDFFADRRDGVFLDVGANHYRDFSNTYYLETALGWSGIAVEPLTSFQADYERYRPRTRFRPFFVSDVSNEEAKLYVLRQNNQITSGDRDFVQKHVGDTTELKVPTITLNDLLRSEGVEHIDFLNMDIELWEPKALAGFDLARYRPALVCIEGHPEVRQQILDYFLERDYTIVGKYLRADLYNLYFAPREPRVTDGRGSD